MAGRLPTDDDWKKLEKTLGMSVSEINMSDEWRGSYEGDLLKEGNRESVLMQVMPAPDYMGLTCMVEIFITKMLMPTFGRQLVK